MSFVSFFGEGSFQLVSFPKADLTFRADGYLSGLCQLSLIQ